MSDRLRVMTSTPDRQIKKTISSSVELEFNKLFYKWQEETKFQSSSLIFENIYYQEIIKYGESVVPYIIKKIKIAPSHLFVALSKITGANPVKPENRGKINEMTSDWIHWWESERNGTPKLS